VGASCCARCGSPSTVGVERENTPQRGCGASGQRAVCFVRELLAQGRQRLRAARARIRPARKGDLFNRRPSVKHIAATDVGEHGLKLLAGPGSSHHRETVTRVVKEVSPSVPGVPGDLEIFQSPTYSTVHGPPALPRGGGGADGTCLLSQSRPFFRSEPGIGARCLNKSQLRRTAFKRQSPSAPLIIKARPGHVVYGLDCSIG